MKKILLIVTLFFSLFGINNISYWSSSTPWVNCAWLPWCPSDSNVASDSWSSGKNIWLNFIVNVTTEFIKFIAVVAVFALIFSGVLYLISMWEEEKVNKAKNWIIYSLVWVFLSVSAWWIISLLNNIRIG